MTKENLQTAINEMLDGKDAKNYHDELVTLLSIVLNASDENIAAAWSEVHFDDDVEGGS